MLLNTWSRRLDCWRGPVSCSAYRRKKSGRQVWFVPMMEAWKARPYRLPLRGCSGDKGLPNRVILVRSGRATLLWAGIFKESMGARHRGGIGLSYRPARLHRLAEFIPWNRFLGSIKMFKNTGSEYEPCWRGKDRTVKDCDFSLVYLFWMYCIQSLSSWQKLWLLRVRRKL